MIRALVRVAVLVCAILLASPSGVQAQSGLVACQGAYCVRPATAVGWVVNLQSGDVAQGSVLAGVSLVRGGGIPYGAGVYGGSLFSSQGARPMLCVLFSVANYAALGPGVVMFKSDGEVIYQATLNISLNLTHGGP